MDYICLLSNKTRYPIDDEPPSAKLPLYTGKDPVSIELT